jgi:hypothetical protein
MIWWSGKLSPAVRLVLDRERPIAVMPAAARARALSRARAALDAGVATRPIPSRAPSAVRWAAAAGLACAATVAVGAAAYSVGVRARPTAPPISASTLADSLVPRARAGAGAIVNLPAAPVRAGTPVQSEGGVLRMEVRLLEQARMAVAREDFALAIQLLAEHARRFREGRLAEEREALRIRALAGLGRRRDARRAAVEFEATFPRSPLLSTVSQVLDSAP